MFFAVYQANSSRSACTRKGHGSNLVHARAFHTGYSQAHWGFSDCCFEVDKDIRQNTLWKTCARWCHHCWTRRNVALSRVKKNKLWIWKAYRRETGELIDWECGGRDKGTLSKLMERLSRWKVELFCTDNWGVYPEVIVADKLYQSKSQTVYLEQNNGRQRHWFARFRRKSIVVSKTLEMVDLTMALFARFHVNGSWKDIASLFSWHPQKSFRDTGEQLFEGHGYILTCPACAAAGHEKATFPFNRCQNKAAAILPVHKIALPVTMTIFNRAWGYARKLRPWDFLAMRKPLACPLMAKIANVSHKRPPLLTFSGIFGDPAVNTLKRDITLRLIPKLLSQTTWNLLWRPVSSEFFLNVSKEKRSSLICIFVFCCSPVGSPLGGTSIICAVFIGISFDFLWNGRRAVAKKSGNFSDGDFPQRALYEFPVNLGKMFCPMTVSRCWGLLCAKQLSWGFLFWQSLC